MAVTITVNSNSYVTLEEANNILELVFDSAEWSALTDEQKKVCLVNATNKINLLFVKGEKLDSSQELMFPRDWETAVSNSVKMAQCYEALEICRYNYKRERELNSGIASRSMDNVSITYAKQANRQRGLYSKDAFDLLKSYLILTYTRC